MFLEWISVLFSGPMFEAGPGGVFLFLAGTTPADESRQLLGSITEYLTFLKVAALGSVFRIALIGFAAYLGMNVLIKMINKWRDVSVPADQIVPDSNTKRIETIAAILRHVVVVVILVVSLLLVLSELGINLAPLLAGAGIAGIAIGFGAQSLVKDVFYGFFILLENQFGIGDIIQVGDSAGVVERMTLRTVSLRDLDGRVHIIPNGDINRVIVYTKEWSRMNLDLTVAYDTNLDKAYQVILDTGRRFFRERPDLLLEEPQILGVESFGDNAIAIKVVAKTFPIKQWEASRTFRKWIKEAFDAAGIEIPFPQRVVHVAKAPDAGPPELAVSD